MVYGRNAILEVQPDEIVYTTDYQKQVSISLTIYVLFGSVHTCYTFHTAFQVRKRKVLKDKGPKVTKKVSKLFCSGRVVLVLHNEYLKLKDRSYCACRFLVTCGLFNLDRLHCSSCTSSTLVVYFISSSSD